jgi:hypothetical protein
MRLSVFEEKLDNLCVKSLRNNVRSAIRVSRTLAFHYVVDLPCLIQKPESGHIILDISYLTFSQNFICSYIFEQCYMDLQWLLHLHHVLVLAWSTVA